MDSVLLLRQPALITSLHRELATQPPPRQWQSPSMLAVVRLAWAMTASTLRAAPQIEAALAVADDDEAVVDLALEDRVFHVLPVYVLASK